MWDALVDLCRMLIFTYAQLFGGNLGAGILLGSLSLRAALFPLSLRIAKESRKQQEKMQKLQPDLERIQEKYRNRPERRAEEMRKLFDKHGVSLLNRSLLLNFAQIPLFIAFYNAVQKAAAVGGRFLWIGNVARPDMLLTIVVTALTCGAVFMSRPSQPPQQSMSTYLLLVPIALTAAFLLKASAGVAIYFGVSSLMSMLQGHVLRRQPSAV